LWLRAKRCFCAPATTATIHKCLAAPNAHHVRGMSTLQRCEWPTGRCGHYSQTLVGRRLLATWVAAAPGRGELRSCTHLGHVHVQRAGGTFDNGAGTAVTGDLWLMRQQGGGVDRHHGSAHEGRGAGSGQLVVRTYAFATVVLSMNQQSYLLLQLESVSSVSCIWLPQTCAVWSLSAGSARCMRGRLARARWRLGRQRSPRAWFRPPTPSLLLLRLVTRKDQA